MEDPIKVWELSKDKTGLPVDLCVIDINEDYQDDDYKVNVDDYPSRLIMQNYYDDTENKEFVPISIDKDNPQLIESKLKISDEDFETVKEFIKKHYDDFIYYIYDTIDIYELKENIYIYNDDSIIKNIVGNGKHNDIININQITENKKNITIKAKLIDISIFDSDKSDIKLITLVTRDNTGIMYSELYFNDIEFCQRVYNLFHINNWYKITGDSFYNEYIERVIIKAKHISEVNNNDIEE